MAAGLEDIVLGLLDDYKESLVRQVAFQVGSCVSVTALCLTVCASLCCVSLCFTVLGLTVLGLTVSHYISLRLTVHFPSGAPDLRPISACRWCRVRNGTYDCLLPWSIDCTQHDHVRWR